MTTRAEVAISENTPPANFNGAGINHLVQTPGGILYLIYINPLVDVVFKKSLDGGVTWSHYTDVFAGSATALSVWYDRWSGIAAGLIHCAYQESGSDDTLYRTINTESADALSTQTTILAGTSTLAGGQLSITRARGGNVYCRTCIDAGSEGGFFRLTNANVPNGAWGAARTINEALATEDQMILLPGWAADNQDIMAFFWDASAEEISRQLYDDSANSWSETSIATSMTDQVATTAFPHFSAAVDIANSRNLLIAWSAVDALNADLRCWHVTESAITEVTNVVQDSVDDQGLCAISIDTNTEDWYVFYGGKSNGVETFPSTINVYSKASQDNGSTWGAETLVTTGTYNLLSLFSVPRFAPFKAGTPPPVVLYNDFTIDRLLINTSLPMQAQAHYQIGLV